MSNALLSSKVIIIEEPAAVPPIQGASLSDTAMLSVTERGPVGGYTLVTSLPAYKKKFGGFIANGDAAISAQLFFDNGGTNLWVSRTVHFSDPTNLASATSVAATGTLYTAVLPAQAAYLAAANVGPYALTTGQTILTKLNGAGAVTTTILATPGSVAGTNAGPYVLVDGMTFSLAIDSEPTFVTTFHTAEFVSIGAATALEVCAVLNAAISAAGAPAIASVNGSGHVVVTTTTAGTGSTVQVVAGGTSYTILGFTAGTGTGTGNVSSIAAVTATEVEVAIVAALGAGLTGAVAGGVPVLTTVLVGSSAGLQVTGGTANTAIGFSLVASAGASAGSFATLGTAGKTTGSYGNGVTMQPATPANNQVGSFNLNIFQLGALVEVWPNLNMIPTDPNYALTIVNDAAKGSDYIALTDGHATAPYSLSVPANGTFGMTGGSDGLAGLADVDFVGNAAGPTGLRAFDTNKALRVLIVPGQATPGVHNGMLTYSSAIRFGSMFAVLDPPAGYTATEINTYALDTAAIVQSTEFGAIYWPNVAITNPDPTVYGTNASIIVPPSGAIAGRYGANDSAAPGGIYEAPAGLEEGPNGIPYGFLADVVGLETNEVQDEAKRDLITPNLINPIVGLAGLPFHMDGCNTLLSTGNFPTIGERRGVIYIEQSIETSLVVFKHRKIKPSTLRGINRSITAFLVIQTNNGAFESDDPTQAFKVNTGSSINTPVDAQAKTMNARVGLVTSKPGEYIVVRVGQDTSALQAQLAAAAAA
jgi:uncharacterized protein